MRCAVFVFLVCAILAGGSSSAFAAFTSITNNPQFPTEAQTIQLLQNLYAPSGPAFSKVGENYTNGSLLVTRIEDRSDLNPTAVADGLLNPVTNAVATTGGNLNGLDQLWKANFTSATAKAVFASFTQQFGYFDGSTGGTYHSLFNVTGSGFGVSGAATISQNSLTDQIIRWARNGDNGFLTSQESDNSDGLDHMITFRVEGLNNGFATWLLMFEDKKFGQQFYDEDYNDLVVQIEASPVAVPEPASIGLLLIGGVAALARRRRNA